MLDEARLLGPISGSGVQRSSLKRCFLMDQRGSPAAAEDTMQCLTRNEPQYNVNMARIESCLALAGAGRFTAARERMREVAATPLGVLGQEAQGA